jgi:glycosyltransferase involved in cell wall biosynthesis
MTVGSLSWEKDPGILLDLLARLLPVYPRLRLVYVGEGPMERELREKAARAGLDAFVRFAGLRSDVPQLLAGADVFALPSVTEGLPGVLIEAGMSGIPAVAFGVGSVDDILKDGQTGLVVPPRNVDAFVRATARLLGDGESRTRMGREAMTMCRRDFDIRRSVGRYEALFRELVRASRRPASVGGIVSNSGPGS